MIKNLLDRIGERKYSGAFPFTENFIAAVKDPETKLGGFIDLDGKYISDERYNMVFSFSGGYALVQKDEGGNGAYTNKQGGYYGFCI